MVYDFGRVLEHITKPAVGRNAMMLYKALLMFERYYEQLESFDHYTHWIGPGIVGMVIHEFTEFMGPLINMKLDHNVMGKEKGTPVCVFVERLRKIVKTVVSEDSEVSSGWLVCVEEIKDKQREPSKDKDNEKKSVSSTKGRGKTRVKHSERKNIEPAEPVSGDDEDGGRDGDSVISVSLPEKQFTTLMAFNGSEVHPPSKKRQQSRFAHKHSSDVSKRLDQLRQAMEDQQQQIIRLTKENETAKSKLLKLQQKRLATKAKILPDFVNSTLAKDLDSDSDIQELGNSKPPVPVDDIVKVTNTNHNSDAESVFHSAQTAKWKR